MPRQDNCSPVGGLSEPESGDACNSAPERQGLRGWQVHWVGEGPGQTACKQALASRARHACLTSCSSSSSSSGCMHRTAHLHCRGPRRQPLQGLLQSKGTGTTLHQKQAGRLPSVMVAALCTGCSSPSGAMPPSVDCSGRGSAAPSATASSVGMQHRHRHPPPTEISCHALLGPRGLPSEQQGGKLTCTLTAGAADGCPDRVTEMPDRSGSPMGARRSQAHSPQETCCEEVCALSNPRRLSSRCWKDDGGPRRAWPKRKTKVPFRQRGDSRLFVLFHSACPQCSIDLNSIKSVLDRTAGVYL